MDEFHYDQSKSKKQRAKRNLKEVTETRDLAKDVDRLTQERQDLQLLQDKFH
ncbi:intracellular transport protein USO1-like [Sesbania bispinosa]|nr:intracellular transport protein USO1-like [Sesbania bispinosa]